MNGNGKRPGWRRAPGWIKLLLILSLSANVLVVGIVVGHEMRLWQGGPFSGKSRNEPGLDRRQSRILRMVPDTSRDEAREILLSRDDDYKNAHETMRTAQQALVEAIRQDPLDPERLSAALAERRAASSEMWGIGYEQLVEIARGLNAAERVELAERLEERTRRWMKRQERKGR